MKFAVICICQNGAFEKVLSFLLGDEIVKGHRPARGRKLRGPYHIHEKHVDVGAFVLELLGQEVVKSGRRVRAYLGLYLHGGVFTLKDFEDFVPHFGLVGLPGDEMDCGLSGLFLFRARIQNGNK